MAKPPSHIALCAAQPIADVDAAPEWLHLLPAGEIRTMDGRGPYRVGDAEALIALSLNAGKIVLDENHSTDLAAPRGGTSPALGWIVELQARSDGIWGRIDWTGAGRRMVEDKAYRGVSPAIAHKRDGTITAILRASLVNQPNIQGLTALHQEDKDMDFKEALIAALGLDEGAGDEAILEAVKAAIEKGKDADEDGGGEAALQAALAPIAAAAGLDKDADATALLGRVQALAAGAGDATADERVVALQSELADVATKLNGLTEATTRKAAETFVDGAIAAGRVGVKPLRAEYVAMHMEDPKRAEMMIGALPVLTGAGLDEKPPVRGDGSLGAADRQVVALMGLDPDAYRKTLAAEAKNEEVL